MRNEKGRSLVELLAVLAISPIIIIIAFSILTSMLKVQDETTVETYLRNEAVLVNRQFDDLMANIDMIQIHPDADVDEDGNFQHFIAVDKQTKIVKDAKGEDIFQEIEVETPVKIDGDSLYINGMKVYEGPYSLASTKFRNEHGNLFIHLVITDVDSGVKFEMEKIYHLQSG